ncbi:MAG: WYL domain-containing protein [Ruminococcaceae bacterium]|nr:WYL domain-containing protein [Oscillospiraceae bacterium]
MAKRENQKQKLFRILELLMRETDEEHGLSMSEIILRLEDYGISAERKSIYDDFLTLGELGFEVTHTQTKPPKYKLNTKIFEIAELKMLVDAVQASKFITAKKSREIIEKLELFAGSHRSRELSRQVYVDDRIKTVNPASIYSIDAIHTAINEDRKLTFKYFDYNGEKKKVFRHGGEPYTVSPCALLWDDEKYYLVAFDEAEQIIKNFRVDKMQETTVLDSVRKIDGVLEKFNPADYSRKIFGMYGGREELVTLECREKLAGVIIDRFGTDPVFIKTEFGFKFSMRVMVSPTFFAWVLGFGEDMRILSPDAVKTKFVENLRKISANY